MKWRLPGIKVPEALKPFGGNLSRDMRATKEGDIWYVLTGATVFEKEGVIRAAFFDPDGSANSGLMVCNWRRGDRYVPEGEGAPDGQGATVPSECMPAQFDLYAGSHFSPPALGPHAIFAAREAWEEHVMWGDNEVKLLRWRGNRSDAFSGLGNLNARYTRIALKFQGFVLKPRPPYQRREDAIRDIAYLMSGKGAYYNPEAGLQVEAGKRGLGAVMTDEFAAEFGGVTYEAQGFASEIIATTKGRYAPDDYFLVSWG